jgi:DNA repair protein RecO (recombination protein O)
MSEIIKTEAVVLHKIKYGDTSVIVTLFTKDFGKMTAIVKGGRNPKSKMGLIVDAFNHLQIVIYKKDSRDIQLISNADIISYFPNIKNDLETLKYAQAVLELIKNLTVEHETNQKLFNGLIRILSLMDESKELAVTSFARFFMFFLSELGYQLQLEKCSRCGKKELLNSELSYNYDLGIFCIDCQANVSETYHINSELFWILLCLKNNKSIAETNKKLVEKSINFMEKHLIHHVSNFKGIQSFNTFNTTISK